MNIHEPVEKHIIDEDFHSDFDEIVVHALGANAILDPDLNQNNPNKEGVRQGAGQQGP